MFPSFLDRIARPPHSHWTVTHHEVIGEIRAQVEAIPSELHPRVTRLIEAAGIPSVYSHQAEAIRLSLAEKNVVLSTSTASGKTLAYQAVVMDRLLGDPDARALFLFPLKALERDQRDAFLAVAGDEGLTAAVYDGDTPEWERRKVRNRPPRVLISNPDMVHLGLLAYHDTWKEFFANLRYVILDEVHTYKGIFGSHISQVLLRLRRVCSLHGSHPRFFASSATIANPGEFVSRLIGEPVEVVDRSGAPASTRHFLFLQPVLSPYTIAARLFVDGLQSGLKTIVFTRARKITELITTWVLHEAPHFRNRISSYRAGFLPEERREIEAKLFSGAMDGVITTSALEMGIDVGGLDLCILVGYPGTVINTWQRSGRVGRSGRPSAIILIGSNDALDQYFLKNPKDFFGRSCEQAVLDPLNKEVLRLHLPCAAAEAPLRQDEAWVSQEEVQSVLADLEKDGVMYRGHEDDAWYSYRKRPHRDVDLRGIGAAFSIFLADGKIPPNPPLQRGEQVSAALQPHLQKAEQQSATLHQPLQRGEQQSGALQPPLQRGEQQGPTLNPPLERREQQSAPLHPPLQREEQLSAPLQPPLQRGEQQSAPLHPPLEGGEQLSAPLQPPLQRGEQEEVHFTKRGTTKRPSARPFSKVFPDCLDQDLVNPATKGHSSPPFSKGGAGGISKGEGRTLLGSTSGIRALTECHEGAVYLHRAQQYLVIKLDLERRNVLVKPARLSYYTRALSEKDTEILGAPLDTAEFPGFVVREGRLKVTERIIAYEKRRTSGQELIGAVELDLPPVHFETVGIWIEIPDKVNQNVQSAGLNFMGGIHALEHAAIAMFPLFALCDRDDIGGISTPHHEQVCRAAVFIYDGHPGGVGLAHHIFARVQELLEKTRSLIQGCPCEDGCPSCIHSPKCGSGNKPLDKKAALLVLNHLLEPEKAMNDKKLSRVRKPRTIQMPVPPQKVDPHTLSPVGRTFQSAGIGRHEYLPHRRKSEEETRSDTPPRIVVFDLETQKLAEDVGGWGNIAGMKMSLAVAYTEEDGFITFTEDTVSELIELLKGADLVVGFNQLRFDYEVLSAYSREDLRALPNLDILADVTKVIGFRLGLDHLAGSTLGRKKSGIGLEAVRWFREGRMDLLEEYCRDDVRITRDLYRFGCENGYLLYRRKNGQVARIPVTWGDVEAKVTAGPKRRASQK